MSNDLRAAEALDMGTIDSYLDYPGLLTATRSLWAIDADRIKLHRDMIGHVYFVKGCSGDYVLKLYRPRHTGNALAAAGVIQYLRGCGYPTVSVAPARTGLTCALIDTPDGSAIDRTMRRFEAFYGGYNKVRSLSDEEILAILDFIPVRHYEIIATIVGCQGLAEVSLAFLDEQHDWLLRWEDMTRRTGKGR